MRDKRTALAGLLAFMLPMLHAQAAPPDDKAAYEEAMRKLQERQAKRQSVTAIKPVTMPATTKPARPTPTITIKDDAPEAVRTLWDNREKCRARKLLKLDTDERNARQRLAADRANKNKSGIDRDNQQLEQIRSEIESVKEAFMVAPPLADMADFKVGYIGEPPQCQIKQVVNANSLILTVIRTPEGFEVRPFDVWLTDFDTSGLTDNMFFTYPRGFSLWINGTKQFVAANGAQRTILLAKTFDPYEFLKQSTPTTQP